MRRLFAIALIVVLAFSAMAGADQKTAEKTKVLKVQDRVDIVLHPGAAKNKAVAVVSATNVNPIRAFSLPMKFVAGSESVRIDSVSFAGTRAAHYRLADYKLYPKRNAVMIMMLSPFKDSANQDLQPGTGEIARIFMSAKGEFPKDSLRMGPIKLPPDNKLMFVTDALAPVEPLFEYRLKKEEPEPPTQAKDE